jgi:hypothetical protein
VNKVEGEFVPVNAMKAKRGRGDIYKVTNRALRKRKLSALTHTKLLTVHYVRGSSQL